MLMLAGFIGIGVLLYAMLLTGLYLFQRRLLFRPNSNLPDPRQLGLPDIEVLHLRAADGQSIFGWYTEQSRADTYTVLYLHGNAGHIGHRLNRMRRMIEHGWGVFLLEYRGFGGNPGQPSEAGLLLDARAGLDLLQRRGIPAERILLWGESLGTNLAIALATEHRVAAVLLESPYTSIADTAQRHYPYVPARRLIKDRFDSLSLIPKVRAPILIMQGAHDKIVPPAMGHVLAQAATAPVELWVAKEAGHNNLAQAGAVDAAAAFVARLSAGTVPPSPSL